MAGINLLWRSSEYSVRQSVRNAMRIVEEQKFRSVAFPLIGAGSGGGSARKIEDVMRNELSGIAFSGEVFIVRFLPNQ